MFKKIIAWGAIISLLTGCVADDSREFTRTDAGALTGALLGGAVGSKFGKGTGSTVGAGVGALLGYSLGSSIAESLTRDDIERHDLTYMRALERNRSGVASSWSNNHTRVSGTVIPTSSYTDTRTHRYCREYTETINIGGRKETAYGTACRMPDGQWEIVR